MRMSNIIARRFWLWMSVNLAVVVVIHAARRDNLKKHPFDITATMSQSRTIVLLIRNAKIGNNGVFWRLSHWVKVKLHFLFFFSHIFLCTLGKLKFNHHFHHLIHFVSCYNIVTVQSHSQPQPERTKKEQCFKIKS